MMPLDMIGMVRACRPTVPCVGLVRQSRDQERSKKYYREACKERDIVCFPSMLRKNMRRIVAYRALRRLYIQFLTRYVIPYYTYFTMKHILQYISFGQVEKIPMMYSIHYWPINYFTLSPAIRMQQMAGKLMSLGFGPMVIPEPDYEWEAYLEISKSKHITRPDKYLIYLYEHLQRKRIKDKWAILSSFIRYYNLHIDYNKEMFIKLFTDHKLRLLLNACIRMNSFTPQEMILLEHWISYLKYPSH
jgi:hypothetical protein